MTHDTPQPEPTRTRLRLPLKGREREDVDNLGDRLTQQLAAQWALIRAERRVGYRDWRDDPHGSSTDFRPAQVPYGYDLAAAWSWRFLVIVAAGFVIAKALAHVAVVTVPLAIALLLAALGSPAVAFLKRMRLPRSLATLLVVVAGLGLIGFLLSFAGQQVASGANDLSKSVVTGLGQIKDWLRTGPLKLTDNQLNDYISKVQDAITNRGNNSQVVTQVTEGVTAAGHVLAGFFIVLFSFYFFMADGDRIWSWVVRLAPRAARERIDSSGHIAWVSLTKFVQATVLVALVDAVGIMIVAAVLGVPFVAAIGVLVFLGAFIPMVGATVAGTVAILVALVDQGPWVALLMLGGVIAVQQIEGHILQPFLMGRFVSIHPLGIIVAIAVGVLVAGIAGALVAVPLTAAVNAVAQHLAEYTPVGDDEPDERLEDDREVLAAARGEEPETGREVAQRELAQADLDQPEADDTQSPQP